MKTASLFGRLVWTVLAATLGVYFLAGILFYQAIEQAAERSLREHLQQQFDLVHGMLEEGDDLDDAPLEQELSDVTLGDWVKPFSGHYYVILTPGERPLLSASLGGKVPDFAEQVPLSDQPLFSEQVGPQGEPLRVLSQRFVFASRFQVHLMVAEPLSDTVQWLTHIRRTLWLSFPGVALVLLLLLWSVTRWTLRPLMALQQHIQQFDVQSQQLLPALPDQSVRDINALHGAFNRLLQRLQRVREAEEQLLLEVSHQIKTPLTIILSTCDVMLTREREATRYQQALQQIRETGRGLRILLTRLLSSAHVDSEQQQQLHLRPLRLEQVVQQAVDMVKLLAQQRQIALHFHGTAETWVEGDAEKLIELCLILLENALQYSPEQTALTVQVSQSTGVTGAWAELRVHDQGPGIPEADRAHIFTRFYRGQQADRVPGTGLGLALARQFAQWHQGELALDTTVLTGACFVLKLPLLSKPSE